MEWDVVWGLRGIVGGRKPTCKERYAYKELMVDYGREPRRCPYGTIVNAETANRAHGAYADA